MSGDKTEKITVLLDEKSKLIIELDKAEELAKTEILKYKKFVKSVNQTKENVKVISDMAISLSPNIENIPQSEWFDIEDKVSELGDTLRLLGDMYRNIPSHDGRGTEFASYSIMTDQLTTDVNTSFTSLSPYLPSPTKDDITRRMIIDNIINNQNTIRQFLMSDFPDKVTMFDSIHLDWVSSNIDGKGGLLLSLRSMIFYQIFDQWCDQSRYMQSRWYPPTNSTKLRYCQSKFFIQGVNEDSRFPLDIQRTIEYLSCNLQQNFDNLSNYGKVGGNENDMDMTYTKILSLFAGAINMRSVILMMYP